MSAAEKQDVAEVDDLQERLELARERVSDAVRANPYATIAAGVGVGIVLGGGIPNWLLRLAAGGAARVAVAQAVRMASAAGPTPLPAEDDDA